MKKNKYISGQALVVVLLALSVVVAITLSAVSKSITDISTTTSEADSLRAFSAAEAGIEQALFTGSSVTQTTLPGGATYTAPYTSSDAGRSFAYPANLLSGENATIWFVSHDSSGNLVCTGHTCYAHPNLDVYWGQYGSAETPAIVFSIYSDTSVPNVVSSNSFSGVKVNKFAFNPNSSDFNVSNFTTSGIDTGEYPIGGVSFKYHVSLTLNQSDIGCNPNTEGCLLFIRFKFVNNTQAQPVGIRVQNGRSLPSQGTKIESLGKSNEISRKVSVFQAYPVPMSQFDSAVFTYGGLVK